MKLAKEDWLILIGLCIPLWIIGISCSIYISMCFIKMDEVNLSMKTREIKPTVNNVSLQESAIPPLIINKECIIDTLAHSIAQDLIACQTP